MQDPNQKQQCQCCGADEHDPEQPDLRIDDDGNFYCMECLREMGLLDNDDEIRQMDDMERKRRLYGPNFYSLF